MIIGSDEFGQLFFPQNDSMFAVVGSKHVTCSVWDDKRQYTGNIVHNAAGIENNVNKFNHYLQVSLSPFKLFTAGKRLIRFRKFTLT